MSSSYRRILKEYYNTYYICALNDINADHLTLDEFDTALFVPDYIAKKENVIEMNSPKKLPSNKIVSKINEKYKKIWTKIIDVLDTTNKGDNVKNNIYPVKNDYEKTLSDLKQEEIKQENAVKKKTLSDLL